jgi:hypothetical protein
MTIHFVINVLVSRLTAYRHFSLMGLMWHSSCIVTIQENGRLLRTAESSHQKIRGKHGQRPDLVPNGLSSLRLLHRVPSLAAELSNQREIAASHSARTVAQSCFSDDLLMPNSWPTWLLDEYRYRTST